MKSGKYRPDLSSLHDVLTSGRHYEIPDYQRRYRWDVSKIDELWEDIVDLYKDQDHRKIEYLLGSIVTVNGNKTTEMVVDGQQRLVSLTLMFCAIRNSLIKYFSKANVELKNEIANLIKRINERIHVKQNLFIKLNNPADRLLFDHICCDGSRNETYEQLKTSAGKAIHKNYDALCTHADALCEELKISNSNLSVVIVLGEILDALTNRVCVIDITVDDENDAQQIFEALNSKGQQLTQADLIKSYLIQKSPDAKKDWDNALTRFESAIKRNPRKLDECIYYSLLSRHTTGKDVGKRELYKQVKKSVKSESDANKFIAKLKEDINIIDELENPQSIPQLDHLLYGLKQVNAIYFRRPIIAAIRTWGWKDQRTEELIDFLLKYFFMYRSICKMDVGKIRNIARDVTNDILTKGGDLQIKDVCKKPLGVVGKTTRKGSNIRLDLDEFHDRFLEEFSNVDYDRRGVILYIFISIERHLQKNHFKIPAEGIDVEHIFPQKTNIDAWPNRTELKAYKNNIGNLTLLPHKWNKILQNYSFEVKKTGIKGKQEILLTGKDNKDEKGKPIVCSYQNSKFELNVDIQKCDKWGVGEIIERQARLKEHAEKIWDLRSYM